MSGYRRGAAAAAVLLATGVAAWLGVPPVVKWQLETRLGALTGREVTVGGASFHPWNLALTIRQLKVAGLPGHKGEPLLQVAAVRVNLSLSSLFRLAPVIEELVVDDPRLSIARVGAGRYDIDDVLARLKPGPAADVPGSKPASFAVYNVQVQGGGVRFDDRPAQRVHVLDKLTLTLPFLSSLPAQVDVKVEPRLAFRLNGASFDTGAQATPFAQTRQGELKLDVREFDVAPYLGYLPEGLPVRPVQGKLSADVALRFVLPPKGTPNVVLQGTVGAADVAVEDAAKRPLFGWRQLSLGLTDVQPLAQRVALGGLRVDGMRLNASRDAAQRINLVQAVAPPAAAGRAPAAPAPAAAASSAWHVSMATLALTDAGLDWRDAAVSPPAALAVDGVSLDAADLHWPLVRPVPVKLSATLRTGPAAAPAAGAVSIDGRVSLSEAHAAVSLKDLSLQALQPYLSQAIVPAVEGRLSMAARIDWGAGKDAPRFTVQADSLSAEGLRVLAPARRGAKAPAAQASIARLDVAGVQADLVQRTVGVARIGLAQPVIGLDRAEQGPFNVMQWVKSPAAPAAAAPASAGAAAAVPPPWQVQLRELAIDDGTLRLDDLQGGTGKRSRQPVHAEVQQLRLRVQDLAWRGDATVPPAKLQLKAFVRGPASDGAAARGAGAVDISGDVGLQPLLLSGKARIDRFPLHRFASYAADAAPMRLQHGDLSYSGKLALRQLPAGLEASATGDLMLGDVRVATLERSGPARETLSVDPDDLFSWQSLALRRVAVAVRPGARPRIEVGEAALNQFYSRLVVTEDGRFNFQEPPSAAGAASAPEGAVALTAPSASAPVPVARAAEEAAVDIVIGGTRLSNGSIDFSDRLVRPNYSAALTELHGEIGAFRSDSREMATLSLRGRAAGTASLDIRGKLNPVVKPLALDIQAKATDLELAPLSPYAGKYAGFAIERGKLSLAVAYRIDADGTLDAKNRVVLNQLTFGDRIDSPTATQLPVRLAVALMKDRNGVIDIELPVSGSVNDPQFSVGGIVWRLIGNLLVKAVTSPFSLLSGGGGEDLSQVAFVPGTAVLTPDGQEAIEKVAKALAERPALKMSVTGAAGPQTEQVAYQRAAIDVRLLADQRREVATAAPAASATVSQTLGPAERSRLLKAMYDRSKLADKPRNALGLAKSLPDGEMETLLRQLVPTNEETWRQLAVQRGVVVRDALIAKGLPSERLFLSAPKLHAVAAGDAPWTPAVQLTLAER